MSESVAKLVALTLVVALLWLDDHRHRRKVERARAAKTKLLVPGIKTEQLRKYADLGEG